MKLLIIIIINEFINKVSLKIKILCFLHIIVKKIDKNILIYSRIIGFNFNFFLLMLLLLYIFGKKEDFEY